MFLYMTTLNKYFIFTQCVYRLSIKPRDWFFNIENGNQAYILQEKKRKRKRKKLHLCLKSIQESKDVILRHIMLHLEVNIHQSKR